MVMRNLTRRYVARKRDYHWILCSLGACLQYIQPTSWQMRHAPCVIFRFGKMGRRPLYRLITMRFTSTAYLSGYTDTRLVRIVVESLLAKPLLIDQKSTKAPKEIC